MLPSSVNRRVGIHDFTFEACSSFTHVAACQIACPPIADVCPEAPTQPVTRPSRSVATMLIDIYMDESSLHWRSAPLRRTFMAAVCLATRLQRSKPLPAKSACRSRARGPLWSAEMVVVVKRPLSPGNTHDASRQAQTSSQHGNRRAACVCGRWPEHGPGWVPEFQDLTRSAGRPRL
jgi:hypothetical protein